MTSLQHVCAAIAVSVTSLQHLKLVDVEIDIIYNMYDTYWLRMKPRLSKNIVLM